jgi:acetyl-CoA synthetase
VTGRTLTLGPPENPLERRLTELLEVERFEPPDQFRQRALITGTDVYTEAERDFRGWWATQATELLDWDEPWQTVLDDSRAPFYRWFVGGRLNACYNCVDRHVEAGRGDRVAFHWRGESGEERTVTYADLHRDVQKLAGTLKALGIGRGDVVGIFLPMIPEVVVAMLACARIGAPHNVVFAGFSAQALAEQLSFSDATALITADGAHRSGGVVALKSRVDEHIKDLEALRAIVVVRHTGDRCDMRPGRDIWWDDALDAPEGCPCEPVDAEHPLFTLYTSGSTAKPKVVVHSTGGYLTGVGWTSRYVFDLKPETDVLWCTADAGWVTGHSYVVYGPLLNGATSVMYEGAPDYPTQDVMWELVARYGVTVFYTAPTIIRACIRWGDEHPARHDLSSLRLLGSVGEPINPKAWLWYHTVVGGSRCPIVDTWWQTETGCIIVSTLPGAIAAKPGAAGRPLPSMRADVVDDDGNPVRGEVGYLVLKRPWPAMLCTLHKEDERYRQTYFGRFEERSYLGRFDERMYFVGDAARIDEDGYFWILGRLDDLINVAGHQLASAEVESAIVAHPAVAEAAAIGQSDELTGQAICAFVVLRRGYAASPELERELQDQVAQQLFEPARPSRIVWTAELPKTRSGKIMRRLLRDIAEGRELGDLTALRDQRVMDELEQRFARETERQLPISAPPGAAPDSTE